MESEIKNCDEIFKCRQCGSCCKGFGGTYIDEQDIERISIFINMDTKIFLEQCCEISGSGYLLSTGKNEYCIFYDQIRQCTIHPVKPLMCRRWPFIRAVFKHPENWNIMAGSCPGMKKDGYVMDEVHLIIH